MTTQPCPYCGAPLEEGTLRSKGGTYFLPAGQKTPGLYSKASMEKRRAILLPPDVFSLFPEWPEALVCRSCRKIIIPYQEQE